MKTPLRLVTFALTCLTTSAGAQAAATPVSDALRATLKRSATNLTAAAEEFPAAKYGFKPTAAQMTVGDIIAHLSGGNDFLCSSISGIEAPKQAEITGKARKAEL